jgi:hypothetical protein
MTDIFSYTKELTFEGDTSKNILGLAIRQKKAHDFESASVFAHRELAKREEEWLEAANAVVCDPILRQDANVQRWIREMPYIHGGGLCELCLVGFSCGIVEILMRNFK